MANIKIVLWTYQKNEDGTFPLRLYIYAHGQSFLGTGYSVREDQWDEKTAGSKEEPS